MLDAERDEDAARREAERFAEDFVRRAMATIARFLEDAGSVRHIDNLIDSVWTDDLNKFDKCELVLFLRAIAFVHGDLLAWAREQTND
jgi:hypothetical protein